MSVIYSRKFWAAVVGLVIITTNHYGLGLDEDQLLGVVLTIVAYITGQGLADFGKEARDGR
jgi:hypothetical protein